MEQGQSWLNNGNVFANIYSGKILPKFTILLIMNYLTGSRQTLRQDPWLCRSANTHHAHTSAPSQSVPKLAQLAGIRARSGLCCCQLGQFRRTDNDGSGRDRLRQGCRQSWIRRWGCTVRRLGQSQLQRAVSVLSLQSISCFQASFPQTQVQASSTSKISPSASDPGAARWGTCSVAGGRPAVRPCRHTRCRA